MKKKNAEGSKQEERNRNNLPIFRLSVRTFVEFLMRAGDLDNRRTTKADREAMQKGSRIHRKIQGKMDASYQAEVSLRCSVRRKHFELVIEGRADGIFTKNGQVYIDEIKGVFRDLQYLQEPVTVHLAQAKCYAFIYAEQKELENISVRMSYCQLETEQMKYFEEHYSFEELQLWFCSLIEEYEKWAAFEAEWRDIRDASIKDLSFPFSYREGQKQLVAGVYRTIQAEKQLFIQASTGVGKTISTVYPSVQAIGQKLADKIFYLTAKTITRTAAEDTFRLLKRQKLRLKVITLTAKEKLCICDEVNCNPVLCERACGHFDRVNECVYDMINQEDEWSRDIILFYADKYQVCPFEMSLDASLWADVIICDYNYVFDYNICLKRFFGESVKQDYIFLIDEAHNLLERGRKMYSAALCKEDFLKAKKLIQKWNQGEKKLIGDLEKCNRLMLAWKKECRTYQLTDTNEIGKLVLQLMRLYADFENFFEEELPVDAVEQSAYRKELLEFFFTIRNFLSIYELLDDHYVLYFEYTQGLFYLHLFCVNPSKNLRHFLENGRSAVFFSATMLPMGYYRELLSGNDDDYAMYAASSFLPQNQQVLLATDVTARYTRRTETEFEKIVFYMKQMVDCRSGNYIAYFPSYHYMETIYEIFTDRFPQIDCIFQKTEMSELEKEEFLQSFEDNDKRIDKEKKTMLAFCVLGGIFGEGIDLKKDRLIGVMIVGTGFPQLCTEREILRNFFQEQERTGFEYAYRYPGINKVLQAAGRVIRTEEDKGIILLLDERFQEPVYQSLFPKEWKRISNCVIDTVYDQMKDFWNSQQD